MNQVNADTGKNSVKKKKKKRSFVEYNLKIVFHKVTDYCSSQQ